MKLPRWNTGAKMPAGAEVRRAPCHYCTAGPTNVVAMRLTVGGIDSPSDVDVCAECLADFVAAGVGHVYIEIPDGRFQEVRAR